MAKAVAVKVLKEHSFGDDGWGECRFLVYFYVILSKLPPSSSRCSSVGGVQLAWLTGTSIRFRRCSCRQYPEPGCLQEPWGQEGYQDLLVSLTVPRIAFWFF